jgi:methylated-DNA-protein-cysteine methyltransferase-like protein
VNRQSHRKPARSKPRKSMPQDRDKERDNDNDKHKDDKHKDKDKGENKDNHTDKRSRVPGCIRALPAGTVSSYGAIAKAAGWPGAARQVVRILREVPGLPWHRVVGSGGAIKLLGENAAEQKFRLRMEGVTFRGARVDMKRHEYHFSKGKVLKKKRVRR